MSYISTITASYATGVASLAYFSASNMDAWAWVGVFSCTLAAWGYKSSIRNAAGLVQGAIGFVVAIIISSNAFAFILTGAIRLGNSEKWNSPSISSFWTFVAAYALLFLPMFVLWWWHKIPTEEEIIERAAVLYRIAPRFTKKVLAANGGNFPWHQLERIVQSCIGNNLSYEDQCKEITTFLTRLSNPLQTQYDIDDVV